MRFRVALVQVLCFSIVIAMSGCGEAQPATDDAIAVVVDTDVAVDDLMALAFLLQRPDVDVLAVTVVGTGEVRCPRGAEIVAGVLEMADRGDIPVACGRSTPLAGDREFPIEWREQADDAFGLDVGRGDDVEDDAVELLTATIAGSNRPVTVLTLGPLTTLAEALDADVPWTPNVEQVVIMGGAVDVPGNVHLENQPEVDQVEWNLFIDPEADSRVMESGLPLLLVPLDATNTVPVTTAMANDVVSISDPTPITAMVQELFRGHPDIGEGGYFFWDPLAAAVVIDPGLVHIEERNLTVQTEGNESGRLTVDPEGDAVRFATWARPPSFEYAFFMTLRGDPPLEPTIELSPPDGAEVPQRFDLATATAQLPLSVDEELLVIVDGPCLADGTSIDEQTDRVEPRKGTITLSLQPGVHTVCVQTSTAGRAGGPHAQVEVTLTELPGVALYDAALVPSDVERGWSGVVRAAEPSDVFGELLCPQATESGIGVLGEAPDVISELYPSDPENPVAFITQALWSRDSVASDFASLRAGVERCEGVVWEPEPGALLSIGGLESLPLGDEAFGFRIHLMFGDVQPTLRMAAFRFGDNGAVLLTMVVPSETGEMPDVAEWDSLVRSAADKLARAVG